MKQKVLLHVACGPARADKINPIFRSADWHELRLDIDPNVQPDIVASITSMPEIDRQR